MRDDGAPLPTTEGRSPTVGRRLAPVEAATLRLVAAGLTTKEIAGRRGISVDGVRSALRRCQAKIGVIDYAALVHNAYRTRQLPTPRGWATVRRPVLNAEQQRLLSLLSVGATARQIASAVYRSRSTVQTRLRSLRAALGAATSAQAVHLGWQYGYLGDEPNQYQGTGGGDA
ncbi:LuxR C-terminal-related transcriptional regulator [Streptomyces sp. NRRL F-5123]|uniref:LuxR C-terminal-related transcriptional regulator n=1 Tax=Streptomyces sp. NRRL F-5123 TaxID=1463856 RepID=UPI0004E131A6|nr:LuxR C-terminal-related transcriptional regulator [Streptomyces sp. NRRL F-5123]